MLTARTRKLLLLAVVFVLCCILLSPYRRSLVLDLPSLFTGNLGADRHPKHAFATFLSTRVANESYDDPYFAATRVLAYQLLHQPSTRRRQGTPFVVIVPPHVSEMRRQILREEGATVVPVDLLVPPNWAARPMEDRWIDQFAKLRMFAMTEYDRILYMDSDTLLTRPLDDIWEEEVVRIPRETKTRSSEGYLDLPASFVLAGAADNERSGRERPTPVTPHSRLNAGFLVFKPDKHLFEYYMTILEKPKGIFDDRFMEMGLLNYAHRNRGPMPWSALPSHRYSNNWPQLVDVGNGSATIHDKFWTSGNKDWIDRELVEMWWRVQGRMEGHWQDKGKTKMPWRL